MLTNFRSHEQTTTHFKPGLNILTGESNSGKTNIFRALRWIAHNRPLGTGMISRASGENIAIASVGMVSGEVVVRERNKTGSINRYRLQIPSQQEQIYEGFGQDVPLEIQEVLGIREVDFGTKKKFSLNFALQLDGPFLLAETDTDAAKILGKLSGTEEVDVASKQVALDIYRNNQREKLLQTELDRIRFEIHQYKDLPNQLEFIEKLSQGIKRLEKDDHAYDTLTAIGEKHLQCTLGMALAEVVLDRKNEIDKIEITYYQLAFAVDRAEKLEKLSRRISMVDQYIYNSAAVLSRTQRIQQLANMSEVISSTMDTRKRLRKVYEKYQLNTKKCDQLVLKENARNVTVINFKVEELVTMRARFLSLYRINYAYALNGDSLANMAAEIDQCKKEIADDEKRFTAGLRELGKCPLCGSQIEGSMAND